MCVPCSEKIGVPHMRAKGVVLGLVGWGGYQVSSFPVILGSAVIYLAAVSRNLEQSGGGHHLICVSLNRGC